MFLRHHVVAAVISENFNVRLSRFSPSAIYMLYLQTFGIRVLRYAPKNGVLYSQRSRNPWTVLEF